MAYNKDRNVSAARGLIDSLRTTTAQVPQLYLGDQTPQTLTAAGTASLLSTTTRINTAAVVAITLPTPTGANTRSDLTTGLVKIFEMVQAGTATVTPSVGTAILLSSIGDTVTYIWDGSRWFVQSSIVAGGLQAPFRYDAIGDNIIPNTPVAVTTTSFGFNGGHPSNVNNGTNSTTLGGSFGSPNTASATAATVVGGVGNTASGTNSTVVGGSINAAQGGNTAILGGTGNTASANNSTVLAGSALTNTQADSAMTQSFRSTQGVRSGFTLVTAAGLTQLAANTNHYLQCDVTLGSQTLRLPSITTATDGQVLYVIMTDDAATGNTVTVDANAGNTIVADATSAGTANVVLALAGPYTSMHLIANLTRLQWVSMNSGTAGVPAPFVAPDYASFYATMPGDNAATVALGGFVDFPTAGVTSAGSTITAATADTFTIATPGDYRVTWQVSVDEPGQLQLNFNGGVVAGSVSGRATGTNQIYGCFLLRTGVAGVLALQNPAGNAAALTITPIAGGASAVNANLIIERIG